MGNPAFFVCSTDCRRSAAANPSTATTILNGSWGAVFSLWATNGRTGYLDANLLCDFQGDHTVGDSGDASVDTAFGYYLHAAFQVIKKRLLLFGLFLLGPDEHKVKDTKYKDQGDKRGETSSSTSYSTSCVCYSCHLFVPPVLKGYPCALAT